MPQPKAFGCLARHLLKSNAAILREAHVSFSKDAHNTKVVCSQDYRDPCDSGNGGLALHAASRKSKRYNFHCNNYMHVVAAKASICRVGTDVSDKLANTNTETNRGVPKVFPTRFAKAASRKQERIPRTSTDITGPPPIPHRILTRRSAVGKRLGPGDILSPSYVMRGVDFDDL